MTHHPTREALDRFLRGGLPEEEAGRIEAHLREGRCFPCLAAAQELIAAGEPDLWETLRRLLRDDGAADLEGEAEIEAALRQGERRGAVIAGERALAPELLAEIERRPPAARREVIRSIPRYQLLGLAQHLGAESREAVFRDVARALELASLAEEVADRLDPRVYGARVAADQQALSRAILGNAHRVASELFEAEKAFQQALLLLQRGNEGSPTHADVGSLLGSLRIDQGRFLEARAVLQEARGIYRSNEYRQEEGKVLIQLSDVEGYSGNPEGAVEILLRAMPMVESVGSERLRLQIHHNLADWTVEAGDALQALTRYEQARPLYEEHCTTPNLQLRQRWLEGRIYSALGDSDLAIAAFEEVRAAARERELSYELATVSLELALVHLRQGETARVRELAEETAPIFRSQELHRHALAAMYLFRQAALSENATAGHVREVLSYLRRARNNPYLRFEPPGRRP